MQSLAARPSRDITKRLRVFVRAGLVSRVPTAWQLLQGQLEMAPYVVLPDDGDQARYEGAILSHPLLRTPLVFREIGLDHLRIGHGLHSSAEGLFKHLNFVFHEGFPTFDIQLIQTLPDGLARFRRYTQAIEDRTSPRRARQRDLVDLVIPNASLYRRRFLEPDGWIDRAVDFDYPSQDELPPFVRPEFASLVAFVNYCAEAYPARPVDQPLRELPGHLIRLATARLRREGMGAPA